MEEVENWTAKTSFRGVCWRGNTLSAAHWRGREVSQCCLPRPPVSFCYQAFGSIAWAGEKVVGYTEWEPLLCAVARGSALRIKTRVSLVPFNVAQGLDPYLFLHPLPSPASSLSVLLVKTAFLFASNMPYWQISEILRVQFQTIAMKGILH